MTISDPKRWDVWLAAVKFDDSEQIKNRPVLVVKEGTYLVLSLKITSHGPRENFEGEYVIKKWKESGLMKPSVVRVSKLLRLQRDSFIKKLGVLGEPDISEISMIYEMVYPSNCYSNRNFIRPDLEPRIRIITLALDPNSKDNSIPPDNLKIVHKFSKGEIGFETARAALIKNHKQV